MSNTISQLMTLATIEKATIVVSRYDFNPNKWYATLAIDRPGLKIQIRNQANTLENAVEALYLQANKFCKKGVSDLEPKMLTAKDVKVVAKARNSPSITYFWDEIPF